MDIIIFNENKNQFEYSGSRPDFIISDKPMQPGSVVATVAVDICHSISFYTIVSAVTNALNSLLFYYSNVGKIEFPDVVPDTDPENRPKMRDYFMGAIAGTILSVKAVAVDAECESMYKCYEWIKYKIDQGDNQYADYAALLDDLSVAAEAIGETAHSNEFLLLCINHFIAVKASEIVRLLNSEKINLRYGYGKWNRSIAAAYDPIRWEYDSNNQRFEITDEFDNIRITNLIRFTLGDEFQGYNIPGGENALFFYTFTDDYGNKRICSSNVEYAAWRPADELQPCEEPICYIDYQDEELKPIS